MQKKLIISLALVSLATAAPRAFSPTLSPTAPVQYTARASVGTITEKLDSIVGQGAYSTGSRGNIREIFTHDKQGRIKTAAKYDIGYGRYFADSLIYSYNKQGYLSEVIHLSDPFDTKPYRYTFTYDSNSNLVKKETSQWGVSPTYKVPSWVSIFSQTFEYDSISNLTKDVQIIDGVKDEWGNPMYPRQTITTQRMPRTHAEIDSFLVTTHVERLEGLDNVDTTITSFKTHEYDQENKTESRIFYSRASLKIQFLVHKVFSYHGGARCNLDFLTTQIAWKRLTKTKIHSFA